MQGDQVVDRGNETGQFVDFIFIVVEAGDQESGQLDVADGGSDFDGPFYRFEGAVTVTGIERFMEGFEINVHGVDMGQQLPQRIGVNQAVGNEHGFKVGGVSQAAGIEDVFERNEGFVVCESYTNIAIDPFGAGNSDQFFGGVISCCGMALGNLPVLAEFAGEVAAIGADGQDGAAGVKAAEWLFFRWDPGQWS